MSVHRHPQGTVALATVLGMPGRLVVSQGNFWTGYENGRCHFAPGEVINPRPLVVLDPEDEPTVDRVANAIRDHHGNSMGVRTGIDWLRTQAALRSLLPPPKPDEPQGLGAVVEDASGDRWVRKGSSTHGEDWTGQIGNGWTSRAWARIDATRVLSEGWSE